MRSVPLQRYVRVAALGLVVLGLVAAQGTARAATVVYSGTTSADQYPLVVSVSGSRIVAVTSMWRATCTSGKGYSYGKAVSLANAPIAIRKGKFSGSVIVPEQLGGGVSAMVTLQLSGTLKGSRLTGSMTGAMAVGSDPSGPSDTCVVPGLKFTIVHQPGRVYGGATSQGLPAVVELRSSRTAISHLHIGWRATCTSGNEFQIGDFLSGGALVGGRFAGKFSTNEPETGGGTITTAYDISGRLSRTAGNGILKLTVTPKDAAGTVEDTCSTPTVTFKLRG